MTMLIVIEGLVILLLLVLVAGLLKSHAEILRQLHRLGAAGPLQEVPSPTRLGTTGFEKAPATEINGLDPHGAARSISLESGKGETLLAFLSTGCASCQVFWESFNEPVTLPTPNTRAVIVTKGTSAESPNKVARLAPRDVPVVMSDDAWDTFRVPLTPYFMLVDGNARVIGEGSATTMGHLMSLFGQSVEDSDPPVHMDTDERERFTDSQLSLSGVEPGDPSLYQNPIEP